MAQLESIVNKADSSGRDMEMGLLGPISSDPMSQQQSKRVEARVNNMGMHHLFVPNKQSMQMETMPINTGTQQMSTTPKRKPPMELLSGSSVTSSKRVAQMGHRPCLQQVSNTSNKGSPLMQSLSNASRPQHLAASSKRKTQMESPSSKSGTPRSLNSKIQNAQMQESSKVQTESSEIVRSKMRESLAAALALVSQQDKHLVPNNNTPNDAAISQDKLENSSQCTGSISASTKTALEQRQEISQSVDSSFAAADAVDDVTGEHRESTTSYEDYSEKCNDCEAGSTTISNNENTLSSLDVSKYEKQDFQSSYTLTTDDVPFSDSFFVKDELLQGNGLSWVLESDMLDVENQKETQTNVEQRSEPEEVGSSCREVVSPELLASRIEAELFKLFGGVNKKYKEKGRSLLFNLKDRNNPELRKRVTYGEIPPEQLCSMTAEELASKELSQWRIAKAEELAQMVVLPDSDVDFRRLVKKTHKGEFQVEVEHEDNVSVEVSGGSTSVDRSQKNSKGVEVPSPSKGDMNIDGEKSNLKKDNPIAITISSNDGSGTDPMQGLMTDETLKETDFLPPIVSLDEFMESLHSEPPFENLPMESGKETPILDKDNSDTGSQSKPCNLAPSEQVAVTPDKSENVRNTCSNPDTEEEMVNAEYGAISSNRRCSESQADMKPPDGHTEEMSTDVMKSASSDAHTDTRLKTEVLTTKCKGDCVWEGVLQLNISTNHSVISIFKSGLKTSAKDWPGLLEIKGRVRLNAFEKFLQELPLSRSRAIMVLHFVSKGSSPSNEQSTLREVAESYISDDRVGFAEPVPRVELYFCPPHKKIVEMLSKILSKEQIEAVNAIDYGLIGIVVWRKANLTSSISPTTSSHHKHSSKKQYLSTRRQQDTNVNSYPAPTPKAVRSTGFNTEPPSPDDDIPPGFGPAGARVKDDLPEFNFSGGSNPSRLVGKPMGLYHSVNQTQSRPVEQMRELVQIYGQNKATVSSVNWQDKFGVTIQPWNDDDDDIPEWQPQTPQNQFPPQHPMHNFNLRPHMPAGSPQQSMMPSQFVHAHLNVMQGQGNLGPQWLPSTQGNNLQPSGGHPYGAPVQSPTWSQNVSRSRGF